jgi:uncharacterized alkaline shock family protein YloU
VAEDESPAPVVTSAGRDRLACGTPVDQLFTQVVEGSPPADIDHQRNCQYCQKTLADLRHMWAPVAELAAEDVYAPPGLVDAVLARIRELTRDPWYVTVSVPGGQTDRNGRHGPGGHLRISARVVAAVARLAATTVPTVGLALGRAAEPQATSPSGQGARNPDVHITVDITVDYGAPLHLVAEAVRRRIATDVHRHTGLTDVTIDVNIIDVHRLHRDQGH